MFNRNVFVLFGSMLFCGLLAVGLIAAQDGKFVPSDIGERIRNNQLDQSKIEARIANVQAQYNDAYQKQTAGDTAALSHDKTELESLKTEALKVAGLDAKEWDVDLDHCCPMKFIAKVKPPEAPKKVESSPAPPASK